MRFDKIFLVIFVGLLFSSGFVVAIEGTAVESKFLIEIGDSLKLTEETSITWEELIIGLAILVMIFSIIYDVMGNTSFETWTKVLISLAASLLISFVGGTYIIMAQFLYVAGQSALLAASIAIVFAIVFFVFGSWYKGKRKLRKLRRAAEKAEYSYRVQERASVAKAKESKAIAKAVGAKRR